MFLAKQKFDRPTVTDVYSKAQEELGRIFPAGSIESGARIGVTAGSRGIANIDRITRGAVDFLKSQGANPFIIPAMGSHGGASAEGQTTLIAHYGITEESMGCPIRAEMGTRVIGKTETGMDVYLAEMAMDSDGVLLINRIKPHTDFKGAIESGLSKIASIGLGKLEGATSYHSRIWELGLEKAFCDAAEKVLGSGKILGGLAILENAYHETAKLAGVPLISLMEDEKKFLKEATGLMGRLPFSECDVLICDQMGKNISGTGMDTNIIGRHIKGYAQGKAWHNGMPGIHRIFIRSLTPETDGNAFGMGLAEFCTQRFLESINQEYSQINAFTSGSTLGAHMPAPLETDKIAIETAVKTCGYRNRGYKVCHILDTLSLETIYLSEQYLEEEETISKVEVLSEPKHLQFDTEGWLQSPFEN